MICLGRFNLFRFPPSVGVAVFSEEYVDDEYYELEDTFGSGETTLEPTAGTDSSSLPSSGNLVLLRQSLEPPAMIILMHQLSSSLVKCTVVEG